MRYCSTCGAQLPDGANNCPSCGTPCAPAPTTNGGSMTMSKYKLTSLLFVALAALLWLVAPFNNSASVTCLKQLTTLFDYLDYLGEIISADPSCLIGITSLISIVLVLIFTLKDNANAAKASALFGLIAFIALFVVGLFVVSSNYGVGFGDLFGAAIKNLGIGAWGLLVSFIVLVGANSKGYE